MRLKTRVAMTLTDGFFYDLLTDAFGNRESDQGADTRRGDSRPAAMTLPTRNTDRIQRLQKRFARRMEAQNRQRFWIGGSAEPGTTAESGVYRAAGPTGRIFATLFDESAFLSPHGLRVYIETSLHALSGARHARCNHRI